MTTAVNIFAVLLVALAGNNTHVVVALESTLTSCSERNTACTYQHELVCSQHSTVSVQGGNQRFHFGVGHCISQGFTCTHGCCTGCTVDMTPQKTNFLRQECDGRQNCSVSVTRTSVTCGVRKKDPFYSHKSTVVYQCVPVPTYLSTTEATQAASRFPESNENVTETQTSPNDVSEKTVTSPGDHTPTPQDVSWATEARSVSTDSTDQSQAEVTEERGTEGSNYGPTSSTPNTPMIKGATAGGSNSGATSGAPNIPVIGGALAGAVILLALCVSTLVCWRRRRFRAHRKEPSTRAVANGAYDLSMDSLEDPLRPRVPRSEVTIAETSAQNAAPDTDYDHLGAKKTDDIRLPEGTYGHLDDGGDVDLYDHTGGKGKRDVIDNVYDSTSPAEMLEEDTYHHSSRTNRPPDVIDGVYDVARPPNETGSDENEALDKTENAAGTHEASEDKSSMETEQASDSTYANC